MYEIPEYRAIASRAIAEKSKNQFINTSLFKVVVHWVITFPAYKAEAFA